MPDVRLPDGTIIRNVPAGTTRSQLMARVEKARGAKPMKERQGLFGEIDAAVRGAADMLTFGFMDEAAAAANSLIPLDKGSKSLWSQGVLSDPVGAFNRAYRSNVAQQRAIDRNDEQYNPGYRLAGQIVGGIAAPVPGASAIRASNLPNVARAAGEGLVQGGLYGFGSGEGDLSNRSAMAGKEGAIGMLGGAAGHTIGKAIGKAATSKLVRKTAEKSTGRSFDIPSPLTQGQEVLFSTVNKAGPERAREALQEAVGFDVPMTLADTHPELRSLAGAAIRRSPTAAEYAESALVPRSRGQIDRFRSAVERDLGPIENIPRLSDDLINQARERASPLYEEAYAAPGRTSDELESLLHTPFGRSALARARTIAANERRDPTALGFDLDDQGEVIFTRAPSTQTLDYVKRGMDDVLEEYRNAITGRLNLDEAGRAQNDVRQRFIREVDTLNPVYAEARQAYAGPAGEREALALGQDAIRTNPDLLAVQIGNQSPERLAQMQTGFRGALVDAAERQRYSSNPFESTLGTPAMEKRLEILYPDSSANFLRHRDIERDMARTTNDILGNSKTAERALADQAFEGGALPSAALDVATNVAFGGVPASASILRAAGNYVRDAGRLGMFGNARRKAEEIAPILLNPNPASTLAQIDDIAAAQAARSDFIMNRDRLYGGVGGAVGVPLFLGGGQ